MAQFLKKWLEHPEWWFNISHNYDDIISFQFGDLLNLEEFLCEDLPGLCIAFDQIPRHVFRHYGGHIYEYFLQKSLTMLENICLDSFYGDTLCFLLLPLRHSQCPAKNLKAISIIWKRIQEEPCYLDIYKRFLKASYERCPLILGEFVDCQKDYNPIDPAILDFNGQDHQAFKNEWNHLEETFNRFIQDKQHIIVSLSGGVDSMMNLLNAFFKTHNQYKNSEDISMNIHDACDDQLEVNMNTVLISARKQYAKFLVPDPYSISWPEIGIQRTDHKCEAIANRGICDYTDNRAFWIGSPNHPSRIILHEWCVTHPKKVHIILFKEKDAFEESFTSMEDHTKYKYLIDAPGQGWSARIKYLMFARRPMFLIDRDNWDWATWDLEPWVHFIPVKRDVSDLIEMIQWADDHPDECKKIVESAFMFMKERLTVENIFKKMEEALGPYLLP